MPHVSVFIHFVWTTKHRCPFLNSKQLRQDTWDHIKQNALQKGIIVDTINGHADHCHCLISLKPNQSISKTMQLVKGESSHWLNEQKLREYFAWQNDYYAVSVSVSMLGKVRNYINNQEEHHRTKTLEEELAALEKKYRFKKYDDGEE